MSDVRTLPAPGGGTIADDPFAAPVTQPFVPAPEPASLGELWSAARTYARSDRSDAEHQRLHAGYAPIVAALGLAEDQNPANFWANDGGLSRNPILNRTRLRPGDPPGRQMVDRATQEQLIADAIRQRRLADPHFLSGVPDQVTALRERFLDEERQRRRAAAVTLSRAPGGVLGTVVPIAGGAFEAQLDPVNVATMMLPTGIGRNILGTVAREAIIGGVSELAQQPIVAANRAALGETFTVGEALENVGSAALGSAVLGPLLEYGGRGVGNLISAARGGDAEAVGRELRRVFDGARFDDAQIDRMAAALLDPENAGHPIEAALGALGNDELAAGLRASAEARGSGLTPDEEAAIHVIEREAEMAEASPFTDTPEGQAAHAETLADTLQRLSADTPDSAPVARETSGEAPSPVARPAIDAPPFETMWGAIIGNEGGTDAQGRFLTSPAGAIGPAQVMPGTAPYAARLAGVPFDDARYRSDHAYNVQLGQAYFRQMLREFGDPSMAAAAYNAGPGSVRRMNGLRGAIERARRAGEPDNWEAYLPAETRQYVANFRRRIGQGDPSTPLRAGGAADDAALAEAEASALTREMAAGEAPPARREQAAFEPVPELRRDLFDSDASWEAAQLRLYRDYDDGFDRLMLPSPDTRGRGVFYHGARGEMPELTEGYYNPANIYGGFNTFYTTDAVDIASGYGRQREAGRIYRATEREPVNLFDMETRLPPQDIERLFGVKEDDLGLAPVAIEEATGADGRVSLREAMDEIREMSRGEGVSRDEVQEIFDNAIYNLQQQGYGGMRHIGGLRTGRAAHDVRIYFDAPNQIDLDDVTPAAFRLPDQRARIDDAFEQAAEATELDEVNLAPFGLPDGDGADAQVESLLHDLVLDAEADPDLAFRLDDDGEARPLIEILADLDSEVSAAEAIMGCLT